MSDPDKTLIDDETRPLTSAEMRRTRFAATFRWVPWLIANLVGWFFGWLLVVFAFSAVGFGTLGGQISVSLQSILILTGIMLLTFQDI